MSPIDASPAPARLERSRGRVALAFKHDGALTRLAHLFQEGCGKARLPRTPPGAPPEAVLLNLAGGLTGGDLFSSAVTWRAGSTATVTSQAAEKIYRAVGTSAAEIESSLAVEEHAEGLWLPQETILFDGARLRRTTTAHVAAGGRLLACETVLLGRWAMNERVRGGLLDERWRVHHAGRLILADRLRWQGNLATLLARPAVANGALGFGMLIHVGADAAALLEPVRGALGRHALHAVASAPDPAALVLRWLIDRPEGWRKSLIAMLLDLFPALRWPANLPRVWYC